MKFAIKAIVAAFCLIATLSTSDARGPYGTINVGNWKGGAYTHDQSGAFTHCAAGAQYASGIYFAVTIDNKAGWSLGFAHDGWAFANGQAFPIVLTFDGQTPFNVHGVPLSGKLLQVPMPDNSALIAQFRKAKTMTAFTQGQLFQFKLDQTAQLLPALANCVATVKKGGVAAAGEFAVAPKQVAAAGPAQPNAAPPKAGRSVSQTGTGASSSAAPDTWSPIST